MGGHLSFTLSKFSLSFGMFTHTYPPLLLSLHSNQRFCSPLPHPSWYVSAICIPQDTPLFRLLAFPKPRRLPLLRMVEPGLTLAMPSTPAGQIFSSSQVFLDPTVHVAYLFTQVPSQLSPVFKPAQVSIGSQELCQDHPHHGPQSHSP